ncbi:Mog1p/PsbP-like protein [Clavulina sp. PMI_390]|nr:Mog1p/PsbP-like protein [Clavulina sp. PMI_390]
MIRELFGGAITVELPDGLIDASDLRQIPDTQEVFLTPDSDVTYIIEILESVNAKDLIEATKFHFESLAHDNDASSSSIESVEISDTTRELPQPTPYILQGSQLVRKYNRPTPDQVQILLALFRVDGHNSDIVLTLNAPVQSSNAEVKTISSGDWITIAHAFHQAVKTFTIVDFGLFA